MTTISEISSLQRSSLLQRFMLLTLIGVGVPLALLSFGSITSIRAILLQDWNVLQIQVGQSVGALLGAHVKGSTSELLALESGLRDASGVLPVPEALAGKANAVFISFLQSGSSAIHLELLDLDGKGIQAGFDFKEDAIRHRIEEAYAAARGSERAVVGQLVFYSKLNQLLFMIAHPIFNARERVGVLLAVVSLEPVLERIREGSWSGTHVFMVDQKGQVIADLERNRMIENEDYSQNEIVKVLLTNVRDLGTITRPFKKVREGRKVEMIGSGVLVPETGWVVIAEIPRSAVYAAVAPVVWRIGFLSASTLLLVLVLSYFFSHRMVRPLSRLADSAREVAGGNFSAEVAVEDKSEIGAVAEAFRSMTRQIRESLARLKQTVEDSKLLFTGTVRALASAIDAKDPYTRGHSERVTRFSVEIAKLMELPEEEVEKIKIAALIHDIGKIAIDDRVLKKPDALTDEEFQIMKTHPGRGYEMMKHIPQLAEIIPGMHSHHEHLDGKGYPQGLKGDQIPMIARVIMVADCFDAMTTKRPYQDPAPIDCVLGKIRSSAGKQYDERVVEALIRGVKTGKIIPHSAT